jgi:RsiW-degrading membrane proteinase PrsW (M82 family)
MSAGLPIRDASPVAGIPDPYRTRKWVGLGLWTVGQLVGGLLFLLLFGVLPLFERNPSGAFFAMAVGAVLAFPAMTMYLTFPRLLDRYDPEPWYALLLCLSWGALAACGFSAFINSVGGELVGAMLGAEWGNAFGTVVSAPLVEEFWKGIMVVGVAYFLRNEFDGVVDGIIYATFVAIGFAATENVIYYGNAFREDSLGFTLLIRGVIAPWGHPLYTSMTGLALGLAREQTSTAAKVILPFLGYAGAVFLHALWNGSALVSDWYGASYVFLLLLPLWLVFVVAFVIMVLVLVVRRGRLIRQHLTDEVALGHLTQAELDLVTSAFGGFVALFRKGFKGQEFVRAVARLGLSKWHTARAMKGSKATVSMDFILPLRAKIRQLRNEGASPAA